MTARETIWNVLLVADTLMANDAAEVTRANAALIEDRACDADFTESRDHCTGLREAAELLTRAASGEQQGSREADAATEDYPGELDMLRGLVATLRVVVRDGRSAEAQRAEVQRLIHEHANDETDALMDTPETSQRGEDQ